MSHLFKRLTLNAAAHFVNSLPLLIDSGEKPSGGVCGNGEFPVHPSADEQDMAIEPKKGH
ncbi:hypothetical protein [Desulfosarcina sp.]|uniref:hypothetical protein n=1 Tax=Desulfosarcina sp. TaxID=2027861 RepID=UPI003566F71C